MSKIRDKIMGWVSGQHAAENGDRAGGQGPSAIRSTVERVLADLGWKCIPAGSLGTVASATAGDNCHIGLIFDAKEEKQILVVYASSVELDSEGEMPAKSRAEVADLLNRVNFGLPSGNFELNLGSGALRFKVAVDFSGTTLAPATVRYMIEAGVEMVDRIFPAILGIVRDGKTAKAMAAELED